jgi:sulfane dehydrogenase subunit SoxC
MSNNTDRGASAPFYVPRIREREQPAYPRRRFMSQATAALASLVGSSAAVNAVGQPIEELAPARVLGTPLGGDGARSPQVNLQRICGGGPGESERPCDIFSNNSKTPLQMLFGTITPADLHFERSHSGTPLIDAKKHRLLVHGLASRSTVFTMEDILRMPSTTRTAFIECAGNGWDNWKEAKPELTVQDTHGLISNSEWTGVPLAFVLEQVGATREATWMLAEGADGAGVDRSIPLTEAVLRNGMLAYAQNGEPLRPTNGYPLRLLVPGYEGNMHIKWLRRLKFGTEPFMTRWETAKYTDLLPNGMARKFTLVQDPCSVITTPSGRMTISRGFVEIRGLAWSGHGRAARVDVSVDGGRTWRRARIVGQSLPQAMARFVIPWSWDGQEALLQSRCTDDQDHVQPTRTQLVVTTGTNAIYHYNAIQTWKVDGNGKVTNAFS